MTRMYQSMLRERCCARNAKLLCGDTWCGKAPREDGAPWRLSSGGPPGWPLPVRAKACMMAAPLGNAPGGACLGPACAGDGERPDGEAGRLRCCACMGAWLPGCACCCCCRSSRGALPRAGAADWGARATGLADALGAWAGAGDARSAAGPAAAAAAAAAAVLSLRLRWENQICACMACSAPGAGQSVACMLGVRAGDAGGGADLDLVRGQPYPVAQGSPHLVRRQRVDCMRQRQPSAVIYDGGIHTPYNSPMYCQDVVRGGVRTVVGGLKGFPLQGRLDCPGGLGLACFLVVAFPVCQVRLTRRVWLSVCMSICTQQVRACTAGPGHRALGLLWGTSTQKAQQGPRTGPHDTVSTADTGH